MRLSAMKEEAVEVWGTHCELLQRATIRCRDDLT